MSVFSSSNANAKEFYSPRWYSVNYPLFEVLFFLNFHSRFKICAIGALDWCGWRKKCVEGTNGLALFLLFRQLILRENSG